MTEQEAAQLAAVLEAHWPHPAIDEFAERALWAALEGVPAQDVERAVMRLVTTGERYQPRAPRIMAALAELDAEDRKARREMAWEEQARTRALPAAEADPADVQAVRDLTARIRGRSVEAMGLPRRTRR